MLSLRSSMVPLPVLGAMRQPGRGMRRADLPDGASPVDILPPAPGGLPLQDWAALFGAVTERLQRLAGDADLPATAGPDRHPSLQECVDALRQLQLGLETSLQGRTQLRPEAEAAAARAPLRDARAPQVHVPIGRQRGGPAVLHDVLARLPNRSHFHARLQGSLRHAGTGASALAVLHLDLEGFSRIHDEHGRDAGDAALCIVAQRLARALRAQDSVGRLGGDAFGCLLVAPAGREQLARLACKLYDVVAAPLQVGPRRFSVQPSIGIAVYPEDGVCGSTLLQHADLAMASARQHQQGYAFFEGRAAP